MVGGQDELVFDGHSMVFNPDGELIARGKQFEEDLIVMDIDLRAVELARLHDPRRRAKIFTSGCLTSLHNKDIRHKSRKKRPKLLQRTVEPLDSTAEVYHALLLGTSDYVKRTCSKKQSSD